MCKIEKTALSFNYIDIFLFIENNVKSPVKNYFSIYLLVILKKPHNKKMAILRAENSILDHFSTNI